MTETRQQMKKPTITQNLIKADFINCKIEHKGTEEPSGIFCDKIEYMHDKDKVGFSEMFDHHLMFWKGDFLVFKVWLPNGKNDKEFEDIFEAMESCGIKCLIRKDEKN